MIDLSKDKFIVKDGIIDEKRLKVIEHTTIHNDDFPWFLASYGTVFKPGISVDAQPIRMEYPKMYEDIQFFHILVGHAKIVSPYVNRIAGPIVEDLGIVKSYRVKLNLQLKSDKIVEGGYNTPHCDVEPESQAHLKVCIVHLNNSDGDTVLFDDDKNEIERIPFKKGRTIYMRPNIMHSGNHPKDHPLREVINFNFWDTELGTEQYE